jgi:hypothetical protein
MDPYGGPAALGGVMTGLMLASWMFGRWQSRPGDPPARAVQENVPESSDSLHAGRPCENAAGAERHVVNAFTALGELHADISAYRQAQQILSDNALRATMQVGWTAPGEDDLCRLIGGSGTPTCPAARLSADPLCPCAACRSASPLPVQTAVPCAVPNLAQPSAEPFGLTLV